MSKRGKMSKHYSKKVFRAGAGYHGLNVAQMPMRGGWRL